MISASDFLHLPYTRDLTEGGIAYALRSVPYSFMRTHDSTYDRLRRTVAGAAVEIAFRRYLSEHKIPFEVKGALPFTDYDRYDVTLGGRRCEIKPFLIRHPEQILQIQRNPELVLNASALVASDQHAAEGYSPRDMYLFAFLMGSVTASQQKLRSIIESQEPHHLIHVMPDAWNHPSRWNPMGKLILKSDSDEAQTIELGGLDEGRAMLSSTIVLPPRTRLEIQGEFFSLAYIHTKSNPTARIGIHSSARRQTYIVDPSDWGNIWVYGLDLWLTGYITREEFSRRASFIPAGSRLFQYNHTRVKNLAIPVSELRSLSGLFERTKMSSSVTTV